MSKTWDELIEDIASSNIAYMDAKSVAKSAKKAEEEALEALQAAQGAFNDAADLACAAAVRAKGGESYRG